ncbi:glycerol-3-phosphate dehydrogenase [Phaffia rhodozyma]|uniref:Glycerol-3-phosphate dehydrogenase [NAD(+)] n=1 Tax=Phaffia rhodozyma TaxID=264483 RepID=A0A0F7SKA4_PHARH|nr:glycerol-3-phosphate dehydrogenase [Phaffia rhodozyma]
MSTTPPSKRETVAIIGSGNWGSAIARLAGINVQKHSDKFEKEVKMWVYEEEVEGRKLTEIINQDHVNVKYLPDVKLPENIVAVPDLVEAVKDATCLVFVMPHQFLDKLLGQLQGKIAEGAKAVSCIKGVDVHGEDIHIFADVIEKDLGVSCSALSGANIAQEVAMDRFSETTIGYRTEVEGKLWQSLFATPQFRVQIIEDVAGVSLCGALKSRSFATLFFLVSSFRVDMLSADRYLGLDVVAVAAGFNDGLGWGQNSKAAIMRIGLLEMKHFCTEFFDDVKESTFLEESAGVADLITTCLGGRNRRCAAAFVGNNKSWDDLEKEMLNGQKLQGIYTAKEINTFLKAKGKVHQICWEGRPAEELTQDLA